MGLFGGIIGDWKTSIFKRENIVGKLGEVFTEIELKYNNIQGEYVVLNNIYVPVNDKTTEIDVLMIHEKGIFVFESKNYSGWIFGDAEGLNWTQCLPNGNKYKFYNPIRQNKTHIKALSEYLGAPMKNFTSFIVFSERCTLKKVPLDTYDVMVVRRNNMLKKLRVILGDKCNIYSKDEINDIANKLRGLTHKSRAEKKQHIENIQNVCPFCGSKLVTRNGKYGNFIGCSAYPKCKFTRNI